MIKLFRKIRQNLLAEGKTGKYLKYAAGEILLVVIGILIALSINNWNTKRIENNRASSFMVKMQTQLEINISRLDGGIKNLKNRYSISDSLIFIIGDENMDNIDEKIDSLVSVNMFDYHLNLNMNTLLEGRENGDLSLIKSDSLRQLIYDFSTMYESIKERERIANKDLIDLFIPYLNKRYNQRNGAIVFFGGNKRMKSKIYKGNNFKMLEDQEFENLIFTRMNYNNGLLYGYKLLKSKLIIINGLLKL